MSKLDDIISSIIDDTPVGEISNVISDLKLIVDKSISAELEESVTRYNVKKFLAIPIGNDNSIILSEYNKQEDGSFIDSAQGLQITVDHLKRITIIKEEIEVDQELADIHKQLKEYVGSKYPNQVDIGVFSKSNSVVQIVIVGEKKNPDNYWNGRWVSSYEFTSSESEIKGEITIDVHYYEDGNVRLTKQKIIEPINAQNLIETINQIEDSLQKELNKSFQKLNESSFKNLRRQLPITRSKINWGKSIGNYRLGKDIANE